eukprot:8819709-Alexandrium_andersonii.AAC.1
MQLLPGELAYFYRKQARRAKNFSGRRGQLMLNQWRGPAVVIGHEAGAQCALATAAARRSARPRQCAEPLPWSSSR